MTKNDLELLQKLPFGLKVLKSQVRIREWYNYWNGQVYVSFSGGKDSTVLKHLVESTVGNVPSVFVDTGLEYPEVRQFALSQSNVVRLKPKKNFKQVLNDYGYPVVSKEVSKKVSEARSKPDGKSAERFKPDNEHDLNYGSRYSFVRYSYLLDAPFKISARCCDVMKKAPIKEYEKETGFKGYVGTMTCESSLRRTSWLRNGGCNAFESNRPLSAPLSFWTENDILQYLSINGLPYCNLYGDIIFNNDTEKYTNTGVSRTGCMFCMFGLGRDGCPNRFQRMKLSHPNIYDYCMRDTEMGGLGLQKVLDFIGYDY